jgi:LytS/YehU family sensor histidine kinase
LQRRFRHVLLVLAVWTLAGLILATQAWFSSQVRGTPVALAHTVAIWLAWAYVWALLTPVALAVLRRVPLKGTGWLVHLLASAVAAVIDLAAYALLAPFVGAISAAGSWWATLSHLFGKALILNIPVYWLIIGIGQYLLVRRANLQRERRELELKAELGEARLEALRAQLQPHFLFNALNTIAVLMHEDVNQAHRTLLQLSQLLRRALESSAVPMVPLRDELTFLDAYLAIETTRFDGRIQYSSTVPGHLLDFPIPGLLLQPLVENAVRHGLAGKGKQNRITLTASRDASHLQIDIADNGCGVAAGHDEGIGLSNTRKRLQVHYGSRYRFDLLTAPGGGTIARLLLPL